MIRTANPFSSEKPDRCGTAPLACSNPRNNVPHRGAGMSRPLLK
jgi:hypothetical protein